MIRRGAWLLAFAAMIPAPACAGDPREVADRLPLFEEAPVFRGTRALAGARSHAAVIGELETVLRAGWVPGRGVGLDAGWRGIWRDPGRADAVDASVVLARDELGLAAGGRVWRWGSHARTSVLLAVSRAVGPGALAAAGMEIHPGQEAGAPRAHAEFLIGDGAWWGGLRAGPEAGTWGAAVGLAAAEGIFVDVQYEGEAPEFGASWFWGGWELRARRREHPLLGAVADVRVVWRGGGR